jgi:hypothetical protein
MGITKSVGGLPEVDENLFAFAQHHFSHTRPFPGVASLTQHWDEGAHRLSISVRISEEIEPQVNELWWSVDRHPAYTFAMEYDTWQSAPMQRTGPATFSAEMTLPSKPQRLDFVSVHQHSLNGSTLTFSSPLKNGLQR